MNLTKKFWIVLGAAFLLRIILLPFFNFGDVNNHVIWGIWGKEFGTSGYYDYLDFFNYARPNQPPLTILLYVAMRYLYEWLFGILWFINVRVPIFPSNLVTIFNDVGYIWILKLPAIIADLLMGVLIFNLALRLKLKRPLLAMSLFLFNPVSWFNSVVWGQTDSIVTFLGLLSILLIFEKKTLVGTALLTLSLIFKATLVPLIPLVFLIIYKQKIKLKKLILPALTSIGIIYLITRPFSVGNTFGWLLNLYTQKILPGELPFITVNAFNFWHLLLGKNLILDSQKFFGIQASFWGLFIFVFFLAIILSRVARQLNTKTLLFSIALITFAAFLFLTRMHERYLYPLFVPLTVLGFTDKNLFKIYWGLSVLHLLNMYHGWWVPRIPLIVSFVNLELVQRITSFAFILIFLYLLRFVYRKFPNEKNI